MNETFFTDEGSDGDDAEAGDVRAQYDMFWQLDLMVSAIGPDDVSPQLVKGLIEAFQEEARRGMNSSDSETITERDIEWLSKATTVTPKWEDTWRQFKEDIRRERIRLGVQLGVESQVDPDRID